MFRISILGLLVSTVPLLAADPAWKTKPVSHWDEQDAKQVLASSPWVKRALAVSLPQLTAEQRREGGATGGGKGVGLKGLGLGGGEDEQARQAALQHAHAGALTIRWESAFPIRAAELKAREMGAPDWEGDAYVLAVYDVPDIKFVGSQKTLTGDLKQAAVLKREGKKDIKPSSVQLMQETNGLAVVVYIFPRTEEISLQDGRVEFVAQIARLSLAQYFYPAEMALDGKLQL